MSRAHIDAILNFKPLNQESAEGIRSLVNCFVENTMALNELVKEEEQFSCFLIRVLSQKLDYPTRRQWELNSTGDEIQTMNQFKTFLEARACALEAAGKSTRNSNSLEKRLQSEPNTKIKYKEFIQEFRDLGHLELDPKADLEKPCDQVFYLPHHSVVKED